MSWFKLLMSPMGDHVMQKMGTNNCAYHNVTHIEECYQFLSMKKVTYDVDVACAILFHDCVYDNKPDKEKRSGSTGTIM